MLVLLPSSGGLTSSTERGHRAVATVLVRGRCPPVQSHGNDSSLDDGEGLLCRSRSPEVRAAAVAGDEVVGACL